MPSRIHWSGRNNRSQHNLVGSIGSAGSSGAEQSSPGSSAAGGGERAAAPAANPGTPGAPPSASPNPSNLINPPLASSNPPASNLSNIAYSSSNSFQPDTSAGPSNAGAIGSLSARGSHAPAPVSQSPSLHSPQAGHQQHQQVPPPQQQHQQHFQPGFYSNSAAASSNPGHIPQQLHHSNSVSGSAYDPRQSDDSAHQVTRSQSHRFSQNTPATTQLYHHQQQYQPCSPPPGSASYEDLPNSLSSPTATSNQDPYLQQQPAPPQPKAKSGGSTRRILRNIFRGQDHQQPQSGGSHGSSSGVTRRNSNRRSLSHPYPPAIRTSPSQLSQVSFEQQQNQVDWQNQTPGAQQPSPQQSVGGYEHRQSCVIDRSDQELHYQNPQSIQHPTIRSVPSSDVDSSSLYRASQDYRQPQGQVQSPGQVPPESQRHQHQEYGHAVYDANTQQPQQQTQQHQFANPQQSAQYQSGTQPSYSGYLEAPQQHNSEAVSQLSHESPVTDSDQRIATNSQIQGFQVQSPVAQAYLSQQPQQQHQHQQQQAMAPPASGGPPPRRSQDVDRGMRDQAQPPSGYRQNQQTNLNPHQPQNVSAQNPGQQGDVQGRNSPQPPQPAPQQAQPAGDRGAEDPEKAFKELLTKYKNVKRLYFDGKKEIEHLHAQVEQLQNAIANQRMSQSRTSLDDNEYTTRFNRLNGAINNLAFNIRKDWASIPQWLIPYVSADALKTGKQEMTAVGRAVITRWLVDELFSRCFHPGLDPELSKHLKQIEYNIRSFNHTNSQEELDALTNKIVTWRMTTLEGLQDVLRSAESQEYRNDYTRKATTNLTGYLFQYLNDPPPAGVEGSASMIIELAVGIASNLPLESRDVAITYPLPEVPVNLDFMEIEKTGLPPLEKRPSDAGEEGGGSGNKESEEGASAQGKDNNNGSGNTAGTNGGGSGSSASKDQQPGKDSRRNNNTSNNNGTLSRSSISRGRGKNNALSRKGSSANGAALQIGSSSVQAKDQQPKVRFAGFVSVEVRGRQVLVKAPVWTL